jgi:hypothetical protein
MISVDFQSDAELNRALQRLADASSLTVREVIPAQARLFAADLAFNTRPLGKTGESQKEGMKRVASRIYGVYPPPGAIVNALKEINENLAKGFVRLCARRKFSQAANILNKHLSGGVQYSVGAFDDGKLHRDQKNSKKVRRALVCPGYTRVEAYLKREQRLVGYAKGGFATAARDLGGVRGIPGYATRQGAPGKGSVTESKDGITVTLENKVKYIRHALDSHGETRAINFRTRSINAVLKRMMDRRVKSASASLK